MGANRCTQPPARKDPVKGYLSVAILLLTGLVASTNVQALVLNVIGVDALGNETPVTEYRWTLEEDTTHAVTLPPAPVADSLSVSIHKSYAPVVAAGDENDPLPDLTAPPFDGTKRYFISVLPDLGYTVGGAPIAASQVAPVEVKVNAGPFPAAQLSVIVFEDNKALSGIYDVPAERGLSNFTIQVHDVAGQLATDTFGDPLEEIVTDVNGRAVVKNLAPGVYDVTAVPNDGEPWVQTVSIGGSPLLTTRVRAGEPPFFAQGGLLNTHVAIGFLKPFRDTTLLPNGSGSITGKIVGARNARPPDAARYAGLPVKDCYVGLNLVEAGTEIAVLMQKCDAANDGTFAIDNVPPGTYQLVAFDLNLDYLMSVRTVTVPAGGVVALGNVPIARWRATLQGSVFDDTDRDGFRDPGEPGRADQAINLRHPDGSVAQATVTGADGTYSLLEVDPLLPNWWIAEVDYARFEATGATFVVDNGGPMSPSPVFPFDLVNAPQPQPGGLSYRIEPGVVLTEGMIVHAGQLMTADFGKAPFELGLDGLQKNGGLSGIVYYATTRAENDPRLAAGEEWEPGIANLQVNLYRDDNPPDGVIDDLDGSGGPTLADVDHYPFQWCGQSPPPCGGAPGPEDVDHNSNNVFDPGDATAIAYTDSFDDNAPTNCVNETGAIDVQQVHGANIQPCAETMQTWNQMRPALFDGGWAFLEHVPDGLFTGNSEEPLASNKHYIVEAVAPPGLETMKEEDKNVDFGDEFTAAAAALPPPLLPVAECVGDPHLVPDDYSLFPLPGVKPFRHGTSPPLCDRKQVYLRAGQNAAADFFMFSAAPKAGRIVGKVVTPFANQNDLNDPNFGGPLAPSYMPVQVRDYRDQEVVTVHTDEWGGFNTLVPSTYTANTPSPSGVSPNVFAACANTPKDDPYYNESFAPFCFNVEVFPGKTSYVLAPIAATEGFLGASAPADCDFPHRIPRIAQVNGPDPNGGPYVTVADGTQQIIITSVGASVAVPDPDNPGFTINRDYGFAAAQGGGSVTVGGVPLTINSWGSTSITATVPVGVTTGQLVVTRDDGGTLSSSMTGVTLTVGGTAPTYVPSPASSIQDAIDAASPGDLILVGPGTYAENLIMWKPVLLQGYGEDTVIDADSFDANKADWLDDLSLRISNAEVTLIEGQRADLASEQGAGITVLAKNAAPAAGGFGIVNGRPNARIDGFTMTGATWGGAILVNGYANALEISNNRLIDNSGSFAGGIRLGWPSLVNVGTLLTDNPGYHSSRNENASIHNNDISRNGSLANGGAIALYNGSDGYDVSGNFICGNYAVANGSAVAHHGLSDQGLIADNRILFNEAFGEGAILIDSEFVPANAKPGTLTPGSGSVTVASNQIQGNLANDDGGALTIFSVSGQDVQDGDAANDHVINVFNNMMVGNAAGFSAGAIALSDSNGPNIRIIHNTIFNNTSAGTAAPFTGGGLTETTPFGAGIVSRGTSRGLQIAAGSDGKLFVDPVLDNNIILHNKSYYWTTVNDPQGELKPNPVSPHWDLQVFGVAGASMNPRNCILSDTTGYDISNIAVADASTIFVDGTAAGAGAYDVALSPGANALANFPNVTPLTLTGDTHIKAGSSAIDTGDSAWDAGYPYLAIDFDREPRPDSADADIGADEYVAALGAEVPRIVFINTATGSNTVLARIEAVDPNGGQLTYAIESVDKTDVPIGSWVPAPTGMVLDPVTGVLSWPNPTSGTYEIEVSVTDGVNTAYKTFTLVIVNPGPNVVPIALDQHLRATKDTPLNINLAFIDPDGPGPSFTIVTPPAFGALTAPTAAGAVTYTPNPGFTGEDFFEWKVFDGSVFSNVAKVSINVGAEAGVFIQCPGDLDGDSVPDGGPANVVCKHVTGGDGYTTMADGKVLYGFGFHDVTGLKVDRVMDEGFLAANGPAPTLVIDEGDQFYLNLTNVPMSVRPDLFDSHTVHFHGYPNASSFYDGVPDASIAVHAGATFTYFYNAPDPGTYMWHCHAEATEHMQMGMLGNLYVRPAQNKTGAPGVPIAQLGGNNDLTAPLGYVYNDGDGSTAYDVEFPIQIGSADGQFRDASESVQPLPFAAMKDNYPLLNGRGYPDTVNPGPLPAPAETGRSVSSQPVSSLITATMGQRILLRISNLNVTRFYTLATDAIPMRVVGKDAKLLRGPTGLDMSYLTNSVTLGGGESVDVILDTENVAQGTYFLYTTNLNYLSNNEEDFGGMMTEIRIQ